MNSQISSIHKRSKGHFVNIYIVIIIVSTIYRVSYCLPFNGSDLKWPLKSRISCVITGVKHPVWDEIRFRCPAFDCETWILFALPTLTVHLVWLINKLRVIMGHSRVMWWRTYLRYWAWSPGEIDLRETFFEIDKVLPELKSCHFRQCSHLNFHNSTMNLK